MKRPFDHQPDLFAGSYARGSDPEPSQEAARRTRFNVQKLEGAVMGVLQDHGTWMSVLTIARALDLDKWSVSPRMKPLLTKGLVERTIRPGLNSNGKVRNLTHWRIKRMRDDNAPQTTTQG